jgi:hypothetical protein
MQITAETILKNSFLGDLLLARSAVRRRRRVVDQQVGLS